MSKILVVADEKSALEESIIDTIIEYNASRRGAASLFHIEYNLIIGQEDGGRK